MAKRPLAVVLCAIVLSGWSSFSTLWAAPPPHIFFTDLTSAPNTGGESVGGFSGAYVTIYGNYFGTSQGSSTVTLNGANCLRVVSWGVPHLWYQKTVVQLGASCTTGNIVVNVAGQNSNGIPFSVRAGNIRCISTSGSDSNPGTFSGGCWRNPNVKYSSLANGDILYIRAGTYPAGITFANSNFNGTAAAPRAIVGYPGEMPIMGYSKWDLYVQAGTSAQNWTFANMRWRGYYTIRMEGDSSGLRFIGNVVDDSTSTGLVMYGTWSGHTILGNDVFKYDNCGSSCSERGYGIYYGGGGKASNIELGWNRIYDDHTSNTNRETKSIQLYGHNSGDALTNVQVHDNWMFNNCMTAVVWGGGDAGDIMPASTGTHYFFNNLIVGNGACALKGFDYSGVQFDAGATTQVINNTFWGNGAGTKNNNPSCDIDRSAGVQVYKNNLFNAPSPLNSYDGYICGSSSSNASGSNNMYVGDGNGPSFTSANVNGGTTGFVNATTSITSANFSLSASSAARDAGVSSGFPSAIASRLAYDITGTPRSGAYDIGAYEYFSGSAPAPDTTPPSVPTGVSATPASTSQINLQWSASTDNVGVTGYRVFRDGVQVGSPAGTSFSDTALAASTTYVYRVAAVDAAGNVSAQSTAVTATTLALPPPPDTTKPTVTINQSSGQADPASTAPVNFTAVFSENVTGFSSADVVVSGTAPGVKTVSLSGSGAIYSVSVSGMTGSGTVVVSIPAGVASDAAGNTNVASTSIDNTVTYSPTSSSDCTPANVICVSSTPGPNQEFATLQAAAGASRPGDTVLVFDGTYAGFRATVSGTSTAPITFKANGNNVVINTADPSGDGIRLSAVSYVTVDGFKIQGMPQRCISAVDASVAAPMVGLTLRNNVCTDSGLEGFYLANVSSSLIQSNQISGSGVSTASDGHGIYLANSASDNDTFSGNVIRNVRRSTGAGIHFGANLSAGGDGIISGLLVENNIISGGAQNGLSLNGVQSSTFQNNLVYGNARNAVRAFAASTASGPKNLRFVNNTFVVPSSSVGWAIAISQDQGGHVLFNNILISDGSGGSLWVNNSNVVSNNNIVVDRFSSNDGAKTISLSAWRALGGTRDQSSRLSTSSALFVNAAGGDFRLKSGSPATDAGVAGLAGVPAPGRDLAGTPRPRGAAFDAGAYEF